MLRDLREYIDALRQTRGRADGRAGAEFAGYVPNETSPQPVYAIEAVTHRDDPIWPTTVEGEPVDEYHTVTGTAAAAEHFKDLRAAGLPVTMAWMPYKFAVHAMVISVASDWRKQLPGVDSLELSRRIWEVIRSGRNKPARYFILDDDVDPTDLGELGWALATRVHPTKRHLVSEEPIPPLLACYTPEERHPKGGEPRTGPTVTYDALVLPEREGRERRASVQYLYPENIKQRVIDHWSGASPAGGRQRSRPISPISSVPPEVSHHGQ